MNFNVVDAVPGSMQEFKVRRDILHLDNNVVILLFARSVIIGLLVRFRENSPGVTSFPTSVIEQLFIVISSRDFFLVLLKLSLA